MKSWNELAWWESDACANTHETLNWYDYGYGSNKPQPWYPAQKDVYRALHRTPLQRVRVVIVGQDPYPTPGFATGLAFSVPVSIVRNRYPPTLRNIFRELCSDLHIDEPSSGNLEGWTDQGVLLWNTSLTIGADGTSHFHLWKDLTNEILSAVREHRDGVVFVMWGRWAQSFLPGLFPDGGTGTHRVITSAHPSPLSARRGFFGSRPFSTVNSYLKDKIDWSLS
jgi:uracil-DNA glycosylase